jgi:3-hydroxyacyl-[acyl-carrier-protein] dehydratase
MKAEAEKMGEFEPMDINSIMQILPHRFPFILIDRIIELDPVPKTDSWVGRKVVAIKNVTINEPFFAGHFPHKPIMPGVLVVEALAQAAAICGYRSENKGPVDVMIASIDNARFRRPVVPGDQLRLTSQIVKDRGSIFYFHCEAHVDGQLVAEADMLAKTFPQGAP